MSRTYFALSTVTRRIQELLEPALSAVFWVKAEISSGRERGGAFYCDLVETATDGRVVAQLRATVWASDLARIRRCFAEAGLPLRLENGTLVGVQCRVQFHGRYGLSLAVLDMDPAFALGELELRRREILARLTADGLLERNARIPVPLLPNRIGLVTSRDSAAFRDFAQTLFSAGYGFRVQLADATVQGAEAEADVLAALDRLSRLPLDLVVIARGGGSKLDLASLDSEALARRIAGFPLPVWTGIGHETDVGVLDHVAGRSFKTPTAVAEELVARFRSQELRLEHARDRCRSVWRTRRRHEREWLAEARQGLRQGTRKLLVLSRSELRRRAGELSSRVASRLARERQRVDELRGALRAQSLAWLGARQRALAERRVALAKDARHRIAELRRAWQYGRRRLRREVALARLARERAGLVSALRLLRASDPGTSLARGFALVYGGDGELLRSVAQVAPGERTETRLVDGRLSSVVREIVEVPHAQEGSELRGEGGAAGGDPPAARRLGDAHR